jgi:AGZA family xanthine/uracil permease-like MFS transporter
MLKLEQVFKLRENGTDIPTEIMAGVTTFMTMCYIIFVQPAILSSCGMDFGAVMVATCLASALATLLMGFYANYPIALAPAMGHNIYFAYTVCGAAASGGLGYPWPVALGAIFISGSIFILVSSLGFREKLIEAVPESLRYAIAIGIGLLIALVGLEWAGLVVDKPVVLVGLGNLTSKPALLSLFGIAVIGILLTLQVKGAIMWGMLATALLGLPLGVIKYQGLISPPPSLSPTLFKLNILDLFTKPEFFSVIFVFFFLDLFDTIGTLIGVSEEGNFMRQGKLPRAQQALLSDAVGTVTGAALGTSTITSYIESAAGISAGGRSGLANIVTAFLMLVALFFYPLVKMIGGGYDAGNGVMLYPVIAPALIIIGCIMMKAMKKIAWDDYSEAIPAFITLIFMPVTFSITEGIALGFISYCLLKAVSGKGKQVSWILYLFSGLFILRYIFLV